VRPPEITESAAGLSARARCSGARYALLYWGSVWSQVLLFYGTNNKAACPSVQQWSVGDWADSFSDLNQSGVLFLLTDLDLAMTFMDIAEASHIEETTRRNRTNARTAYDTVLRLLEKLTPNADQSQAIDAKLASLKTRLQAVGQQF